MSRFARAAVTFSLGVVAVVILSSLPASAQFLNVSRRVGGSQCVPVYYGDTDYKNTPDGFTYDDGGSGTGFAHCPTGEHTSSSLTVYSADVKYLDSSSSRCLTCFWYLKTHNGSTYYSGYRYSDGAAGNSCDSSYTGYGTMTWSSFSWGSVSNIAQINALCILPRFGGTQTIQSYRVTTNLPFQI